MDMTNGVFNNAQVYGNDWFRMAVLISQIHLVQFILDKRKPSHGHAQCQNETVHTDGGT